MDSFALTAEALKEPWRLWTGHITHFGGGHAFINLIALAIPGLLAPSKDRLRIALSFLVIAPLLSLLILHQLGGGQYRGASGLACALWAVVGLRLARKQERPWLGALLLGLLSLKLILEAQSGNALTHPVVWQLLPGAHLLGAELGLILGGSWNWVNYKGAQTTASA